MAMPIEQLTLSWRRSTLSLIDCWIRNRVVDRVHGEVLVVGEHRPVAEELDDEAGAALLNDFADYVVDDAEGRQPGCLGLALFHPRRVDDVDEGDGLTDPQVRVAEVLEQVH